MITAKNPDNCVFCGYYMTIDEKYTGQRCIDPTHWQAVGQLAPHDFYTMARLVAGTGAELVRRSANRAVVASQMYR